MRLHELPTFRADGAVYVVIESPRGSTVKLKYNGDLGVMMLSRPLTLGLRYPFDWGFVPGTRSPDKDPLDALVLSDAGVPSGVVVACRAVGVLEVDQKRKDGPGRVRNDRILAVPVNLPRWSGTQDLDDVCPRVRDELASFFVAVTAFENKDLRVLGWQGRERAEALIEAAQRELQMTGG